MNLANKVTVARFFIAVLFFVVFEVWAIPQSRRPGGFPWAIDASLVLFLTAAISDFLDGHIARKYNIVTDFGRVTDPFVDKIVVCGAFVLFLGQEDLARLMPGWMVVVIIAREFLVNSIRSLMEAKGIPFGATFWGKQKMVLQCICIGSALLYLAHLRGQAWAETIVAALFWITTLSTVASGVVYVIQGRAVFLARA